MKRNIFFFDKKNIGEGYILISIHLFVNVNFYIISLSVHFFFNRKKQMTERCKSFSLTSHFIDLYVFKNFRFSISNFETFGFYDEK